MSSFAKLQWQCRRGTKELDILLQYYLQTQYTQSSAEDKHLFKELLKLEDDQLSSTLLDGKQAASPQLSNLLAKLRQHSIK